MEQEKIWDYFQGERVDSFDGNATRLDFMAKRLRTTDQRVLNIGVGNGYLEKVVRYQKRVEIYSLDPGEAAIESLREKLGMDGDHAKVGYSQSMPFANGTFDVVVMSEVIEHLDDAIISATFGEIARVLTPQGRYIGTVPADENLASSQVACPKCGEIFHRWGHVQSFSPERLRQMLERDFDQVVVRRVYFGSWRTLNWKGRATWMVKKLLHLIGASGTGHNFYFEAVRRA